MFFIDSLLKAKRFCTLIWDREFNWKSARAPVSPERTATEIPRAAHVWHLLYWVFCAVANTTWENLHTRSMYDCNFFKRLRTNLWRSFENAYGLVYPKPHLKRQMKSAQRNFGNYGTSADRKVHTKDALIVSSQQARGVFAGSTEKRPLKSIKICGLRCITMKTGWNEKFSQKKSVSYSIRLDSAEFLQFIGGRGKGRYWSKPSVSKRCDPSTDLVCHTRQVVKVVYGIRSLEPYL